jgi:hypothetical protein
VTDWHKVPLEVDRSFLGKYRYGRNGIANLVFVRAGGGGMKLVALKISETPRQGSILD